MVGADGVGDNGVGGEEQADESVLPPGPRRSTYTPPPQKKPSDGGDATADEAVAEAMAASLAAATGSINVIYQLDDIAPSVPEGVPVEQLAASPAGTRIRLADEATDGPSTGERNGAVVPPVFDASSLPSPTASAIPANLPPPPGETAAPIFGVDAEPAPVFGVDAEPAAEDAVASAIPEFGAQSESVEPAVAESAADESTEARPEEPVEEQPDATVVEPAPVEPAPGEPELGEPELGEPELVEPELGEPELGEPTFVEPVFVEPVFVEPTVIENPTFAQTPVDAAVFEQEFSETPVADASVDDSYYGLPGPEVAGNSESPVFDLTPPPEEPFDEAAALAKLGAPSGRQRQLPVRQSLRDDELAHLLETATNNPDGTLGIMEEFERQLTLRGDEAREFTEWRATMLAVGTPEARAAVEAIGADFSDMVETSSIPVQEMPPIAQDFSDFDVSTPVFDAPPPAFTAPPPTLSAPPPAFEAPPPLADAPPPAFQAPPPLADAPPPAFEAPPPLADAPPPVFDAPPPLVEPPAFVEPPAMPDAWAIQPGSAIAGSETEFDAPPAPQPPAPLVEPGVRAGEAEFDRVFTGAFPVVTGSIDIPPQLLDVDGDDPVDPTDQVPVYGALSDVPIQGATTAEPIHSPRIPDDEIVLGEEQELKRPRLFSLEAAALEPTPQDQRVGRAARMFWMWFAANSSVVSIAFGALIFSLDMSLRQAIVGIVAGVAASLVPLGLGTLAGKRSSQPTMVVSRAVFGVVGNAIPAAIALLSRVFWGAAMLWLLGRGVAAILEGAQLTGGLSTELVTLIAMGGGFVIALVIAVFGYRLIAAFQLFVTIISSILIVGLIALTSNRISIATALTFADGSWWLAATAAVLVFSFVGLLWANSTGDLARYQRAESSGAGSMLWATFGTALPSLVLISYGALLAASNPDIAAGLLTNPLDTLALLLPVWYPAPLVAATALSLISGVVVTLYSGGFAFKALGMSFSRVASVVVVAVLVAAGAYSLTLLGADLTALFRDLATTLAVPVAAWAGIFAADTMIRNRRYHSDSLVKSGGVYPTVHWVNLPALLVISAIGFGLTTASVSWLQWQGFVYSAIGIPIDGELAGADLGVFVALLLGVLVPIVAGIPSIRRQEAAATRRN